MAKAVRLVVLELAGNLCQVERGGGRDDVVVDTGFCPRERLAVAVAIECRLPDRIGVALGQEPRMHVLRHVALEYGVVHVDDEYLAGLVALIARHFEL